MTPITGPLLAPIVVSFANRGARMTKRRVLIVEDNQDAGEMYRMLIELAGHEVLAG